MIRLFSFILLSLVPAVLAGQSLVNGKDLHFNSDVEKIAFERYLNKGETDFLALFMGVDEGVSDAKLNESRNQFEELLTDLEGSKLEKKKPENRISIVFRKVHDGFLVRYREQNHFNEIFQNGNYNCVSGTALYGMVFHDLDIPFAVRERPTHVYLEAYPNTYKVMVEATNPIRGDNMYSESFKRQFVKNLSENKLISEAKYESSSTDDLFSEYYFNDETITLEELVGIQYMNDAIYRMEDNDYQGAFNQLEKAYIFYPSQKCSFMLLMNGVRLLNEGSYYDDPTLVRLLSKVSRYTEFGVTNDMVVGEFQRMKEEVLVKNNDSEQFESMYTELVELLEGHEALADIKYAYSYERGRVLYNQGKYLSALPYFEELNRVQPNNLQAQGILVSTVLQTVKNEPDTEKVVSFLEKEANLFPAILDNNNFTSALASAYLFEFAKNYRFDRPATGEEWRGKFEKLVSEHSELSINYDMIGEAYSNAVVYYFRRGMKTKAREFVNAGLKISPNNYELLQRQRMLR